MKRKIPVKYVLLNFVLFIPGFLFGIFDNSVSIMFYEKMLSMNFFLFFLLYFAVVYLLYITAKRFTQMIEIIIIKDNKSFKKNLTIGLRLILLSGYVGYLVNLSTLFMLVSLSYYN